MCETRVALHCCGFCWVAFCAPLHFASIDFMCVFFSSLPPWANRKKKCCCLSVPHQEVLFVFFILRLADTPGNKEGESKMCEGGWQQRSPLGHQHFKSLLRVEKDWREWDTSHEYSGRGNGTTPDLSEVTCIHALLRQVSYSFNGLYGFNHLPFSRTDKKEKIRRRRQRRRKWLFWMIMILGWMTFICIYEKKEKVLHGIHYCFGAVFLVVIPSN